MKPKVAIIGAGSVGCQAAIAIAQQGVANVVLIDIVGDIAKGKALDIQQSCALSNSDVAVTGGADYSLIKDAAIVVITAGIPRKEGMTRDQVLEINFNILSEVITKVKTIAPDSVLIIVTNPLDAMVYAAWKLSSFAKNKVLGMAGVLDSARFRTFLAEAANVPISSVTGIVIGSHNDYMVPLVETATIQGRAAAEVLEKLALEDVIKKTKKGGEEIISLLKQGSAFVAPGMAIFRMVLAILHDTREILPCHSLIHPQISEKQLFTGIPTELSKYGGTGKKLPDLNEAEQQAWNISLKKSMESCKKIDSLLARKLLENA